MSSARPQSELGRVNAGAPSPLRICVVGSGTRFLSGISYHTNRLSRALAARHRTSVILMRQLLPSRLYPGRARVGKHLADLDYPEGTAVLDGVDWFWAPSILRALGFLRSERPEVIVFQWWSGTVLHTYLALAVAARLMGARVVIEYHEVLDTGELAIAPARWYVTALAPLFFDLAHGHIFHNEFDRDSLRSHYGLGQRPARVMPLGPFDQYLDTAAHAQEIAEPGASGGVCELLYFGVIRPFKGLEDLIEAFELFSDADAARFRLTVVGETWEGWSRPAEMIKASRRRDSISFVNRYVTDEEAARFFAAADAVVLPYHRSSASGPLHLAMAHGLPVVVTAVGGLVEAAAGYQGAIMIAPRDPAEIARGLLEVHGLRGRRFEAVHSWDSTLARYEGLFEEVIAHS